MQIEQIQPLHQKIRLEAGTGSGKLGYVLPKKGRGVAELSILNWEII